MANPNAESIVTAIAEKGIVGISGGQYFIKDFFQMDSHDETYNERLAAISQPAKESKRGWW